MSTIAFDTLAYAKKLKAAGFNEAQAEALALTVAADTAPEGGRLQETACSGRGEGPS